MRREASSAIRRALTNSVLVALTYLPLINISYASGLVEIDSDATRQAADDAIASALLGAKLSNARVALGTISETTTSGNNESAEQSNSAASKDGASKPPPFGAQNSLRLNVI